MVLAAAVPALAQTPTPLGPQFQVNTDTAGGQFFDSVAMTPDDGFVAVWGSDTSLTDPNNTNPNDVSIQARRYAADGSPLGSSFQVDTATGFQFYSSVAVADDGRFVISWTDTDTLFPTRPSGMEVMAQRYAASGAPSGTNFVVNSATSGDQAYSNVALASNGDFVVVWEEGFPVGPGPRPIEGRLFAASGAPVSADFTIDAGGGQSAVAVAPNGDFTVVWTSSATSDFNVKARRYAANGPALGAAFQVNTYTTGLQRWPGVAVAPSGDFVVVWSSEGSAGTDTSGTSVQAQRYAADGSPVGGEFQVNTGTTNDQGYPSVATDAGGGFVVAWAGLLPGGGSDLFGQRFAANGTPLGSEFQVNDYPNGSTPIPDVAAGDDGFVVAWTSLGSPGNDSSSYSAQARLFAFVAPTEVPSLSVPLAAACAVALLVAAGARLRRRG